MLYSFYMDISCGCSYDQWQQISGILPRERIERIEKLNSAEKAEKQLLVGGFLQYSLSSVLGIPMENISYTYGTYGKPELSGEKTGWKGKGIHFNLSHSGSYAVLAVSDHPVGIDIEYLRKNRLAVAKRCFCPEEYEDILRAGDILKQEQRFLEYWTMKEAYIKYTGTGLSTPLNSFLIRLCDEGGSYVSLPEGQRVYFATVPFENADYVISICSKERTELLSFSGKNLMEITLEQILNLQK